MEDSKVLYLLLTIINLSIAIRNNPTFHNWEPGLREAVYQSLLIEKQHTDPALRDQILEAPLLGRQSNPSPFGDIAVLGKGQLYLTPDGFKFVQEPNIENDSKCTECHNKLIALWTVKRIRHRDPDLGHFFEIEYTISPITQFNEELARRHGFFDYNIPGHIFVLKSDSDKWKKNHHEFVIGASDNYKHVSRSSPRIYTSYQPQEYTTVDPKEYELYKKLIESLASKTTTLPYKEFFVPVTRAPTVHFYNPLEQPLKPTQSSRMQIQQVDVLPILSPTESMQSVTTKQVQPSETKKDQTTPKITTLFVAIPEEEMSTTIEKIPYAITQPQNKQNFYNSTTSSNADRTLSKSTNFVQSTEALTTKKPITHFYFAAENETPNTEKATLPSSTQKSIISIRPTRRPTTIFFIDFETKPKQDVNIDAIFGTVPTTPLQYTESTTEHFRQSDVDKVLFRSNKATTETSDTTKIIYENFFTPAEEFKPSTDQSFSTSISFEVNGRKIMKRLEKPTTEKVEQETKKVLDDFALRLISHAKGVDYLQMKPSRRPKYKRRSYTTRRRKTRKSTSRNKKSN